MKKPQRQQTLQTEEEVTLVASGEEETLVAPRFDDEETLVARPVVPLDAETVEAQTHAHAPAPAPYAATPLPAYARRSLAPRRSWLLALVLISVLVGGVLGGAGLYLYQRQANDDRAVAETPPETPAETQTQQQQQQPAPEPTAEASNVPQPETPAAVAEPAEAVDAAPEAVEEAPAAAPAARETEPAAGRRDDTQPSRDNGARKRGKKGENDEEAERPRPVARADRDAPREARRVDTIFYRERRAMRRERARARRDGGDDVNRLRRIFEGAP
jgi:hypothetical protein